MPKSESRFALIVSSALANSPASFPLWREQRQTAQQKGVAMKCKLLAPAILAIALIGSCCMATQGYAAPRNCWEGSFDACASNCPDAGDCNAGPRVCQQRRLACIRA